MNLWTVPASDIQSLTNVGRSLSAPVIQDILAQFGLASPLFAWGSKVGANNTKNVLERMKAGDICLFYTLGETSHEKKYNWAGRIYQTTQNRKLAESIWSDPAFELVYLMDETRRISMTIEEWSQIAGYEPRAPQGLSRVSDVITNRILDKFGSIDVWLKSLSEGRGAETVIPAPEPHTPLPPPPQIVPPAHHDPVEVTRYIHQYSSARGFTFTVSAIRRLYAASRAKPFVILAGNSGTGKSRLARLFAEAIGANIGNGRFQMVPVRPDWNDSSDLLGYFDLNGDYRPGQLIATILRADSQRNKPFFVCLDEMNLARVEHYFSDFLSIIESRRIENGSVISDPVLREEHIGRMNRDSLPADVAATLEATQRHPRPIGLPPNLYVIGTVNMDETTQPFSRKVLDRANTLEFNEIDLEEGLNDDGAGKRLPPLDLGSDFLASDYTSLNDVPAKDRDTAMKVAAFLQGLNASLAEAGFEVGYRVRDESIAFMIYALAAGMSREEAEENIVLQKVLPRVQGSSPRIETALLSLMKRLAGDEEVPDREATDFTMRLDQLRVRPDASPVLRKLAGMLLIFREEGFTSFWLA